MKINTLKILFGVNVFLFSCMLHAQKQEVIYEVDGIVVQSVYLIELKDLTEKDIHSIQEVDDPSKIDRLGYHQVKKLVQITTKNFVNRPDSLKQIPSSKQMQRIKGKWHLNNKPNPYSGPFRDYYVNGKLQGKGTFKDGKLDGERWLFFEDGKVSEQMQYKNGFPDGKEVRYFLDGEIKQIGFYENGYEVGEWKKFHPNGNLKQVSFFSENGKLNGEVKSYYSTGALKGSSNFVNGELVETKKEKKLQQLYEAGEQYFKLANFSKAIEEFSHCIKLKSTWNDAYFARGTAYLNNNQFEKALADFNQAIQIEPLDAYAYTNRAFTLLRKQEFEDANKPESDHKSPIFGSSKVDVTVEVIDQICKDLQKAKGLGDESRMLLEALLNYCN